jgi:hypothetical protein
MPPPDRGTDRSNQLLHIKRVLDEYRVTKDRQLLRRAIELWDEAEAAYKVRADPNRMRIH